MNKPATHHDFIGEIKRHNKENGTWPNLYSTKIANTFQVTTCYRESSSMLGGWYEETFVWLLKDEGKDRDLFSDALQTRGHFKVCELVAKHGHNLNTFLEEE